MLTYYGSHIDPGAEEAEEEEVEEEEASWVTASSFRTSCSAVPFEVDYAVYEKKIYLLNKTTEILNCTYNARNFLIFFIFLEGDSGCA